MDFVFEVVDKSGRKIRLSSERWRHILRHPNMHDQLENIKLILQNPPIVRYSENDEKVVFFYKEFKHKDPSDKYLFVSVKYLNSEGFIISSFFTNRITGLK